MTLSEFITKIGDVEFSKRFNVSRRAACAYRLRKRIPRPDLGARIVANSPVSYAGIYGQGPSNWRQGAQAE